MLAIHTGEGKEFMKIIIDERRLREYE